MSESEYILNRIMYLYCCTILFVQPKYRRVVFSKAVDQTLKDVCLEIEKRYDVHFLEIERTKIMFIFWFKVFPRWVRLLWSRLWKASPPRKFSKNTPKWKQTLGRRNFGLKDFLSTRSASLEMRRALRSMFVTKGFRKSTLFCIQVNSWHCFKIPRCSAARSFISYFFSKNLFGRMWSKSKSDK